MLFSHFHLCQCLVTLSTPSVFPDVQMVLCSFVTTVCHWIPLKGAWLSSQPPSFMYLYTLMSLIFSKLSHISLYLSSRVMLQYIKQLGGPPLDTLQLALWQSIPSLYCWPRLLCPRCSTFHLPSLNFITFLLTHSFCLSQSLAVSALTSSTVTLPPVWNHLQTYNLLFHCSQD